MIVYDNTGFVCIDKTFNAYVDDDGIVFNSETGESVTFSYDSEEEAHDEMMNMMKALEMGTKIYLLRFSSDYKEYMEEIKRKRAAVKNYENLHKDQDGNKIQTNFQNLTE